MSASIIAGSGRAPAPPAALDQAGIDLRPGERCEPRSEPLEDAAHFVDSSISVGSSGATTSPRAAGVDREAVLLQHAQALQHRLARHAEGGGELLLGQPRAGGELAAADGIEQPLVDLLGEVRCGLDSLKERQRHT